MAAWARHKMTTRSWRPRLFIHPSLKLRALRRRRERLYARMDRYVVEYEARPDIGARVVRFCESYGAEFWFEVTRLEYVALISKGPMLASRKLPAFAVRLLKAYRAHVYQHLSEHPLGRKRYKFIRNVPPGASI